uniref:Uncharacterized protein n=1 Tax=Sphaerodactylus townsendi TaxID=933632 RepID=A0ACB8EUR6_9SAUR
MNKKSEFSLLLSVPAAQPDYFNTGHAALSRVNTLLNQYIWKGATHSRIAVSRRFVIIILLVSTAAPFLPYLLEAREENPKLHCHLILCPHSSGLFIGEAFILCVCLSVFSHILLCSGRRYFAACHFLCPCRWREGEGKECASEEPWACGEQQNQ